MVIVFGGAYQGKLDFVKGKFNILDSDICNLKKDDLDLNKKVIYHFEEVKRRDIKYDLEDLKDKILIINDESCGLVPIDPIDRKYREEIGREVVTLSKIADEVYRVFLGLGEKIK